MVRFFPPKVDGEPWQPREAQEAQLPGGPSGADPVYYAMIIEEEERMSYGQSDYQRVESAIRYLRDHAAARPDLAAVARSVHLSAFHFQRLFIRWAGISPKRFIQHLTVEHAKEVLRTSRSLLDATYDAGLSSPGRLHDLFVTLEAVTPGEFKRGGEGVRMAYGMHDTPLGTCLVAVTGRGVCEMAFPATKKETSDVVHEIRRRWPEARIRRDQDATRGVVEQIFRRPALAPGASLPVLVRGTNFQIKVWRALLEIPPGALISYEDLARRAGMPGAQRAVGRALAVNPVCYLIPCHRVIRSDGSLGGYRWGVHRKQAMLVREQASRQEKEMLSPE